MCGEEGRGIENEAGRNCIKVLACLGIWVPSLILLCFLIVFAIGLHQFYNQNAPFSHVS